MLESIDTTTQCGFCVGRLWETLITVAAVTVPVCLICQQFNKHSLHHWCWSLRCPCRLQARSSFWVLAGEHPAYDAFSISQCRSICGECWWETHVCVCVFHYEHWKISCLQRQPLWCKCEFFWMEVKPFVSGGQFGGSRGYNEICSACWC